MYNIEYDRLKELVDQHLLSFLPEIDGKSGKVREAMEYSLNCGGKRLRPVLLLAACKFCGGEERRALPFACAIEYIHTYSLIHDDLPCMDDDDLRRGHPTNHKVYGEDHALLAGDALLNSAFEVMIRDLFLYMDERRTLLCHIRALNEIAKGSGCRGMIAGQCADLESQNKQCSKEMLEYIHLNKTGALIVSAVRAGAYLACSDINTLDDLSSYAESLGLAFQITDDLLDLFGNEEDLGKRPGRDVEKQKATYPALYGVDASRQKVLQETENAVRIMESYEERGSFFVQLARALAERIS
jgi:geranylgeranyl diphosphate synthase type II